ncbi:hypothetical protein [Streptomyces luteogriseus]|uniref:hypothetical protein n=1 Tax=Streptomyces luteogriseus TaxID=68233 RepID=UPI0037177854
MSPSHREHGEDDLRSTGTTLYERAPLQGRSPAEQARPAPCLVGLGLLHPSLDDPSLLEPVAPVVAPHRLSRGSGERIASERRREAQLAETFGSLMRIAGSGPTAGDAHTIRLLTGTERIGRAITDAMADASEELLTVQPRTGLTGERGQAADAASLGRDQAALDAAAAYAPCTRTRCATFRSSRPVAGA